MSKIKSFITNKFFIFDVTSTLLAYILAIIIMPAINLLCIHTHIVAFGVDPGIGVLGQPIKQISYMMFWYFCMIQLITHTKREIIIELTSYQSWFKVYLISAISGLLIFGAISVINFYSLFERFTYYTSYLGYSVYKIKDVMVAELGMRMGLYTFYLLVFYSMSCFITFKLFKRYKLL